MSDSGQRSPPSGLAIVTFDPRPYRIHLCRRLATELTGLRLHSLFVVVSVGSPWISETLPPEINPVIFDTVATDYARGTARHWIAEQRRGGRVVRYLERHRIAAVILQGYSSPTLARTLSYCYRAGIPAFVRGDSNIKGDRPRSMVKAWLKRRIIGWVVRRSSGVMPAGSLGQQYFVRYGADPRRCFWVPYEPDYGYWQTVPEADLAALRQQTGLDPARRKLLYCGRLVGIKRVDLLLDSFARIAERRPGWDLVIAGDGPLRQELVERAGPTIGHRVYWLGMCDTDRLRAVYHMCDSLVLPSDYEPWGLVVNEAMAAGLTIVASDMVGSAHELVRDGMCGRIVPAADVEALTEALLEVTDEATLERYRRTVPESLSEWRRRADPVEGVRAALRAVGLAA